MSCAAVAGATTSETGPGRPCRSCSSEAWMLNQRPLSPRSRTTAGPGSRWAATARARATTE
ncbi:hypothetical protein ABZ912_49805 [Nonomuraea angiospora]|uniref:hypothetical protein n=1 Tax=Nonomuraea angiospora TaxID=46172 RepID=UPI0033FED548